MNKADGAEFRQLLREVVAGQLGGCKKVALLFSGGTDSLTVLWTLLDLNVDVKCYVFRLAEVESADSRVAALAAEAWGVSLNIVCSPVQSLPELAADVQRVVEIINVSRKTHVEMGWPFWHLLRSVAEQNVWCGIQADTLWGSGREMKIKCRLPQSHNRLGFLEARRKAIADPMQEGLASMLKLASFFGKSLRSPYTNKNIREFMLGFSWHELNKPKQKWLALTGFESEFRSIPIYRRNDNLQCGSGVREHMTRLRDDPSINKRGWKNMAKLYEDLGRSAS